MTAALRWMKSRLIIVEPILSINPARCPRHPGRPSRHPLRPRRRRLPSRRTASSTSSSKSSPAARPSPGSPGASSPPSPSGPRDPQAARIGDAVQDVLFGAGHREARDQLPGACLQRGHACSTAWAVIPTSSVNRRLQSSQQYSNSGILLLVDHQPGDRLRPEIGALLRHRSPRPTAFSSSTVGAGRKAARPCRPAPAPDSRASRL